MKTIRFKVWDCVIEKSSYGNGRPALILNDARDGEQVAVATVNLPDVPAGRNEVFIKDYSENEGMLKALTEAGVVMPTLDFVQSGFVQIARAELLPPFRERTLSKILSEKSEPCSPESPEKNSEREM